MEKNNYIVKNNKIACSLYLDVETFKKVERVRGLTKRSTFIENILKCGIEPETV